MGINRNVTEQTANDALVEYMTGRRFVVYNPHRQLPRVDDWLRGLVDFDNHLSNRVQGP